MRDGGVDGATCTGRDGTGCIGAGGIDDGADRDAMVRGGIDGDARLIGAIREGGDAAGRGGGAGITIVRYGSNAAGEGASCLDGASDAGFRIATARAAVSDAGRSSGEGTSVVASPTEGTCARSLARAARSSSVESATIVAPSFATFSAPEARGIREIRAAPNARCANVVTLTHASSRGRPLSHARCGPSERTSSDAPSCMTTTWTGATSAARTRQVPFVPTVNGIFA